MTRLLLGLGTGPLPQLVGLIVGGLVFYFGLSGLSYLVFFVLGRARFHPGYVPDPASQRSAMAWGAVGVVGNAVLMLPLQLLVTAGHSQVYWDVAEHGWGWLVLSVGLYLAFTETLIYWAHRWLHRVPFLYDRLHAIHHRWRASTPWVSMAFHPLDSFVQALPHHLAMFLFPVHGLVYLTMLSFVSVWTVLIHDRVTFVRWWPINHTDHHTVHHWCGDHNYGQFTTLWDRLMGSHRDPEVLAAADPGLREVMSHHARRVPSPAA